MVERMKSCGILARFSAQSVSMMPSFSWSSSSTKPFSFQKSPTGVHSCSAGRFTTSQRWLPARSMRTSPTEDTAVMPGVTAAWAACWPLAVTAVPGTL
ncbi:hypothetical protein D9M68_794310 [compost metagenome]